VAGNYPITAQTTSSDKTKKRGFWSRLFGGSKSDNKYDNKDKRPASAPASDRPPQ
jgi:hypothetical protein